ncbi:MAG: ERCC4 domain-containing protein [Candidatus Nanoarchaeia archaeon]|nr:ERCC4 domain-containing protein [Candidatus Nanoarchaeia archaeon]MDD5053931.1 ERCC4 domain-containing protein [Candidatus Nanoarchaeia archaeon]
MISNLIIVDNREFRSNVVKELFKLGAEMSSRQLSAGDYIIGDLCIERKSLEDFHDSMIDKRIFPQLRGLKANYEKRLLIVEGEGSGRNIHPNAVKGLIASIVVDYGISVIFLKDCCETAELLSIIDKRLGKKVSIIPKCEGMGNDYDSAINLLCNIPGIGFHNAKKLADSFKSLKNIFLAEKNDLKKVLGDKKSIKFFEFIEKAL